MKNDETGHVRWTPSVIRKPSARASIRAGSGADVMVTYDRRQADAAAAAGLLVLAPWEADERAAGVSAPYVRPQSPVGNGWVAMPTIGRSRCTSFFQMFGNFSFGDYFKEKAIPYAWEFLTGPVANGGLGLPESRLWVTVYTDDDEAEHIWRTVVGVPAERIQRLGMAENFWSMGVPGPCGPCSEICFDRGPEYGREGGPIADDERYLEIWNLVFMQHIRGEGPAKEGYPILGDLPAKNISTGLGLERMAALLQGVDTIFDIDTTRQILDLAATLSGARSGKNCRDDVALRVVADHILTSVMLIGDGVTPSNEGRGYILRRILRRAVRAMRVLGSQEPVVHDLVACTINVMSPIYSELAADAGRSL